MEKLKELISNKKTEIIFFIILIIAIFIRIYKIEIIPLGIHVDEAGMAYDAFCLANYGTDRFLNKFPIYLINFGGGQSALYAYLSSIFIKLIGFNIYSIRLPAAILGIITIILSFFMIKKERDNKIALIFLGLITICPWHIMASRWGLDCNLLAPLSLISIYFLIKAKDIKGYIISGIFFGITLYTYALSYIIIPIFLLFSLSFMLYTKRIKLKEVLILGITILIFAIPLFLFILINNGYIEEINSFVTIPKLWFYRGTEVHFSSIIQNLNFFKIMFFGEHLIYNSLPEFGTVYYISIPFAMYGFLVEIGKLVRNVKNKKFDFGSIMIFLFLAVLFCMLIIEDLNVNKANAIYIPLLFFISSALKDLYDKKIFFYVIIVIYIFNFINFIYFYNVEYSNKYKYQPLFEYDLINALNFVEDNNNLSQKNIYINTSSNEPYIYTLINNPILPYEFNKQLHDGYNNGLSYGKYYFYRNDINFDAVYIIKDDDELVNNLKQNDFNIKNIESYIVAYK